MVERDAGPQACLASRTRAAPGLRLVANIARQELGDEAALLGAATKSAARRRKEDARK
jgi:hypothetical protein